MPTSNGTSNLQNLYYYNEKAAHKLWTASRL